MPELLWHALSQGLTRPVPGQDVPLWFAALLVVGLLGAGVLIGSGVFQWAHNVHQKRVRVRVRQTEKRSKPSRRGTGGTGAAAA